MEMVYTCVCVCIHTYVHTSVYSPYELLVKPKLKIVYLYYSNCCTLYLVRKKSMHMYICVYMYAYTV